MSINQNGNTILKSRRMMVGAFLFFAIVLLIALAQVYSRAQAVIDRDPALLPAPGAKLPASISIQQSQGNPKKDIEAELITIHPTGFAPATITRPHGKFLLAVDNRSGTEEVTLRLDRVQGNRLHEQRVHRKSLDWRGLVELPPGSYELREATHPDWVCRITITSQ